MEDILFSTYQALKSKSDYMKLKNYTTRTMSDLLPREIKILVTAFVLTLTGFSLSWAQPTVVTLSSAGTSTWSCPAGVTSIQVECWGGSGGGGGVLGGVASAGGGGGGGAYSRTT